MARLQPTVDSDCFFDGVVPRSDNHYQILQGICVSLEGEAAVVRYHDLPATADAALTLTRLYLSPEQKAKFCSGVALQLRVALGLPAGEVKAVVLFNTAQRIFKKSETTTGIVSFDISAAPDNKLADREVYDYHLHVWLPKRANQPADQSGRPPFEHVVLRIGERKDFSQGDQVVAAAVKPTRRRSKADLKELTDAEHALAKADMQKQYRATQRLAACKARLESTDEVTFVLFRQPSLDAELGTFSTSISVSRADVGSSSRQIARASSFNLPPGECEASLALLEQCQPLVIQYVHDASPAPKQSGSKAAQTVKAVPKNQPDKVTSVARARIMNTDALEQRAPAAVGGVASKSGMAGAVMLRSTAWKRQHPSTQTPLMAAMQHEGRQHGMLPIKRHCPEPVTCPGSVQQTLDTGECTQQSGGAAGLLFPDAACRVCGRPDEEARLVLCDGCDAPYHTGCMTPALEAVPEGDWLCPACILSSGAAESMQCPALSAPCSVAAVIGWQLESSASHLVVAVDLTEGCKCFAASSTNKWSLAHQLGQLALDVGILWNPAAIGMCTIQAPLTSPSTPCQPQQTLLSVLLDVLQSAIQQLQQDLPSPALSIALLVAASGRTSKADKEPTLVLGESEALSLGELASGLLGCIRALMPSVKVWLDVHATWTAEHKVPLFQLASLEAVSGHLRHREAVTMSEHTSMDTARSIMRMDRPVALACFFQNRTQAVSQALECLYGDCCRPVRLICIEQGGKINQIAYGTDLPKTRSLSGSQLQLKATSLLSLDALAASSCGRCAPIMPPDLTFCEQLACHCISKAGLVRALLVAFAPEMILHTESWLKQQVAVAAESAGAVTWFKINEGPHAALNAPAIYTDKDAERIGAAIAQLLLGIPSQAAALPLVAKQPIGEHA